VYLSFRPIIFSTVSFSLELTPEHLYNTQTLQALSGIVFSQIRKWQEESKVPSTPEYTIRDQSCPKEYLDVLDDSSAFNFVTM
jgi:hypothetical protein